MPVAAQPEAGLYTTASLDERTRELIVKAVNVTPAARAAEVHLHGLTPAGAAKVTTLANADLEAETSFDPPTNVAPE